MIERGGCFGFTLEAFERLRVVRHIFGKEFQSDGAVESSVLGLVDNTHAATPEFFEDAVVGNSLAERRLGIRHRRESYAAPPPKSTRRCIAINPANNQLNDDSTAPQNAVVSSWGRAW